ncbi:MAG TPA: HAMP domain-containing sensor histidine kinase [Gemmataceae bacterium]|nr:HAMP domain-containing sensor histidine kinase [Gemmataceae bacterium]
MARRWRLRNKLLLGLGLVVCCVAALIAGTAYGLTSYMGTMKTTDSKLAELLTLDQLKPDAAAILSDPATPPAKPNPADAAIEVNTDARTGEVRRARQKLEQAKSIFTHYKALFEETVRRHRDPDPYQDTQLVAVIEKTFAALEAAIDHFADPQTVTASKPLAQDENVAKQHQLLLKAIDDLRNEVAKDMYDRIGQARTEYRRSIVIVSAATAVSLLLVGTLVSLFSGWVFKPIRDLQAGVRRVTEGDFTQSIDLQSGDELEDLAVAFNEMTSRLHDVYRDLEHQVDERSRQLVRSERMVSVGFLAAGVAHEINNPLASIAFCSEALQTRLSDYLARNPHETDVVQKYLRMIQQEAFRCKGITSRLLEFSRVGERRREPTDLAELIQGVLEIAQHLQSCRGKRIIFQPYSRVVAGVCGEDIKSVVLNLVVNALESMQEGGVLTITLKAVGATAEMLFTDTGCGMPPDVLDNIFEPFYTRSRTGKGTGLGLFISHHIVAQHGGEIRATSAGPGQGSTFTVRVPLTPAQAQNESHGILPFGRARTPAGIQTEDGIGNAA